MLKPDSSLFFNKELAKDKRILLSFAKYLKDTKLDPNQVLLYTDNRLLIGIYLHFFEVTYNIGVHADRTCFLIFYIDENNVKDAIFPFYKTGGFTPYIYEWYARTERELATASEHYADAILYIIQRLVKPF